MDFYKVLKEPTGSWGVEGSREREGPEIHKKQRKTKNKKLTSILKFK